MLRARVITAVVLLALLWAAAAWSREALLGLLGLLVAVAMYEWVRLAGFGQAAAAIAAAIFGAALLTTATVGLRVPPAAAAGASGLACLLWCGLGAIVVRAERGTCRIAPPASILLAIVLLSTGWIALEELLGGGVLWLVSALAVVWIADIAAYFTGRALGRHKLAPRISPGKTWEGVAGALAAVALIALLLHTLRPQARLWSNAVLADRSWPVALVGLWGVVAVSIVGDLFESLLKRQAQVKDSGRLLPGHGGVLDRIDATLPALPAAVLIDWWTR